MIYAMFLAYMPTGGKRETIPGVPTGRTRQKEATFSSTQPSIVLQVLHDDSRYVLCSRPPSMAFHNFYVRCQLDSSSHHLAFPMTTMQLSLNYLAPDPLSRYFCQGYCKGYLLSIKPLNP
jgi:hypothetical protein